MGTLLEKINHVRKKYWMRGLPLEFNISGMGAKAIAKWMTKFADKMEEESNEKLYLVRIKVLDKIAPEHVFAAHSDLVVGISTIGYNLVAHDELISYYNSTEHFIRHVEENKLTPTELRELFYLHAGTVFGTIARINTKFHGLYTTNNLQLVRYKDTFYLLTPYNDLTTSFTLLVQLMLFHYGLKHVVRMYEVPLDGDSGIIIAGQKFNGFLEPSDDVTLVEPSPFPYQIDKFITSNVLRDNLHKRYALALVQYEKGILDQYVFSSVLYYRYGVFYSTIMHALESGHYRVLQSYPLTDPEDLSEKDQMVIEILKNLMKESGG